MNTWLVTVVEGAAETLALAEGLGVDPTQVLDLLAGGALDAPYLQAKGAAMIRRDFEPSFRLALAAKDARLAEDAAAAAGLDLPLIGAIRARMERGRAAAPGRGHVGHVPHERAARLTAPADSDSPGARVTTRVAGAAEAT